MRIFEPKRKIYREKMKKIKICEFCNKKNIEKQECKNLSGKHWMVFVSKYPYLDGNLMLIPRRHLYDIQELSKEEEVEFFKILKKSTKKLGEIFKTKDFNVGLNIGKNAGASIEHMHWQIIPRKLKIQNATNIFADLHVITIMPEQLKEEIERD